MLTYGYAFQEQEWCPERNYKVDKPLLKSLMHTQAELLGEARVVNDCYTRLAAMLESVSLRKGELVQLRDLNKLWAGYVDDVQFFSESFEDLLERYPDGEAALSHVNVSALSSYIHSGVWRYGPDSESRDDVLAPSAASFVRTLMPRVPAETAAQLNSWLEELSVGCARLGALYSVLEENFQPLLQQLRAENRKKWKTETRVF